MAFQGTSPNLLPDTRSNCSLPEELQCQQCPQGQQSVAGLGGKSPPTRRLWARSINSLPSWVGPSKRCPPLSPLTCFPFSCPNQAEPGCSQSILVLPAEGNGNSLQAAHSKHSKHWQALKRMLLCSHTCTILIPWLFHPLPVTQDQLQEEMASKTEEASLCICEPSKKPVGADSLSLQHTYRVGRTGRLKRQAS